MRPYAPYPAAYVWGHRRRTGVSELTIRAMLGHASQNGKQDYIHIDEAFKLALPPNPWNRTSSVQQTQKTFLDILR